MSGGITVEPATPADAVDVAVLYAHHVIHGVATFETQPPDTAEMAARIAKVQGGGHPWLVARDGAGDMLGYAYAGLFHPRAAYRFTCEDSVYVRHDRLGEGIGSLLLAALIEAAENSGFRQMIAQIAADEGGSVALHRRFGFAEVGRTTAVGRKHGRWLDVVIMQRALGRGDTAPPREEP
jgi:L-amino acid N-acyltransferase YncA